MHMEGLPDTHRRMALPIVKPLDANEPKPFAHTVVSLLQKLFIEKFYIIHVHHDGSSKHLHAARSLTRYTKPSPKNIATDLHTMPKRHNPKRDTSPPGKLKRDLFYSVQAHCCTIRFLRIQISPIHS